LQQNANFGGSNRENATNAVGVIGTNYRAAISATDNWRFFRLKQL